MEIIQILVQLLAYPDVPKFYRQLHLAFQSQNKTNEAAAIDYLIEKRFGKNEPFNPVGSEKQRENNNENPGINPSPQQQDPCS